MVGSLPGLTFGATLPTRLADEARLKIGEPDLVRPLVDDVAAQDDVVACVVQAEDDETTNTGGAHLAQRDLHGAAIGRVAVFAAGRFAHLAIKPARILQANYL